MCGQVDLIPLRQIVPTLACCAQSVLYDTRTYNCSSVTSDDQGLPKQGSKIVYATTARYRQITTTPNMLQPNFAKASRTIDLPSDHLPLTCEHHMFYIEPPIREYYKCCGSDSFDYRLQTCQRRPDDRYVIQPKGSHVRNRIFHIQLKCRDVTFIFESMLTASRYSC